MKISFLPKVVLAAASLSLLASPTFAADKKHRPDRSDLQSRFETNVSNDSSRNRQIRNEKVADYERSHNNSHDRNRTYYRGSYGYPGYYSYAPYYYSRPRTSVSIGLGTSYYNTGYSGYSTSYYRDTERPIYRGERVSERNSSSLEISVQQKLSRLGYYSGPIDGDIGEGSRRAILRFQRDNDLSQTGRIDRRLVDALGLS